VLRRLLVWLRGRLGSRVGLVGRRVHRVDRLRRRRW
jgi:hypothetical protein